MSTTTTKLPASRSKRWAFALALASSCFLTGAGPKKSSVKADKKVQEPKPLDQQSFQEILSKYTLVGDFEEKDAERPVSDEVFWKYNYVLPKVEFPIHVAFDDLKKELPPTRGSGRAIDHLNRGRILFLEKKYNEAKATWLSARARYGKEFPFHRRNDYFTGYAFLNYSYADAKEKGVTVEDAQIRGNMANAATFLSWAFIMKADQPDPVVDEMTPKGLYNLAAIYWKFDRFAGAYGAADTAMNFLRKTGRKEFRPAFHRILAESFVKSRSYLEAVQELDQAIRQDPDPVQASAAFARIGDIYFDLNNYDLAEDAYGLGAKIDEDMRQMNPAQLVLRGESLFWLGRFSESQKMLHFALQGGVYRSVTANLPPDFGGWAALRIADSYLARKEFDKAKLEYYKVGHEYRAHPAGRIAKMREACLELPFYNGNNVKHARELLELAKQGEMPPVAQELAWSCQVASYTERERTPEMLGRVKDFAGTYPESRFLKSFVTPVREYQATQIEPYFASGDVYRALSFFEKNRKNLFPKVPEDLQRRLFVAYADVHKAKSAAEFFAAYHKTSDSDMKALREAVVAAEMVDQKGGDVWIKRNKQNQKDLVKRSWRQPPDKLAASYFNRMLSVSTLNGHLDWLYSLARNFGNHDETYLCDVEYPMLSRLNDSGASRRSLVEKRSTELIQGHLPGLFRQDESCALSLLELEARGLRETPKELAARYLARGEWPLVGGYLHLFWTISEHVYDAGEVPLARRMWEVIKEKGPAASPEVEFAKARLDPTKTEFEKLWN